MKEPTDIWLEKAENLKKQKKFEESVKFVDRARKFKEEKKGEDYWFQRGLALTQVRQYEQAIECFDKDLQSNKFTFNCFFEKAVVLYILKKYRDSVECFNKAWEVKYADFSKLDRQAQTLKDHRKFEKSVMFADKAKHVDPLPMQFWHYKGLALHELKHYDESIKSFKEALAIKPEDSEVLYDLSKSYLLTGNIEKCLEVLQHACQLDEGTRKRLMVDPNFSQLSDNSDFREIRDVNRFPASYFCSGNTSNQSI